MKKIMNKKVLILLLAIPLVLVVFLFIVGLFSKTTTDILDCSDSKKLADYLTRDIDPKDYYLELNNNKITSFVTRRNIREPQITYPGHSIFLILRHDKKDSVSNLQSDVIKMLEDQSYKTSDMNVGYAKEEIMYNVSVNNEWVTFEKLSYSDREVPAFNAKPDQSGAEEVGVFSIKCGVKNKEIDALYDELLPTDLVKKQIAQFSPVTNYNFEINPRTVFGIKKNHKNNVVETSIFSTGGGGGYALWLQKTVSGWIEVYAGQEFPACGLLEGLKIESGVDCLDQSLENRTTK